MDQSGLSLIAEIQKGLPFCERPYAEIGSRIGMSEKEVIARLQTMQEEKLIKRMGVIVRHKELGYKANAMVVWDIPDEEIETIGQTIGQKDFVTLCYQRPRRLPEWPYNLFCMIHGKDRQAVLSQVESLIDDCDLKETDHAVLFSIRRFKQRGARYIKEQARHG